ncbi:MAG: hypothetical protein WDN49_03215 [Acetobacteraceae bacterium]
MVPIGVPRVAEPRGAAQGRTAFPAHPDRQTRLLHRLRVEDDAAERDVLAGETRLLLGPQRAEGLQVFVRHCAARREGRRADRLEFFLQPARAMPTARRPPDSTSIVERIFAVSTAGRCGTTITEVTRIQAGRLGGDEGDRGQLLMPGRAGAGGKLAGFRIGVARLDVRRDDDVVAEGGIVEPDRLAADADADKVLRGGEWSCYGCVEPDLHGVLQLFAFRQALPHDAENGVRPQAGTGTVR